MCLHNYFIWIYPIDGAFQNRNLRMCIITKLFYKWKTAVLLELSPS